MQYDFRYYFYTKKIADTFHYHGETSKLDSKQIGYKWLIHNYKLKLAPLIRFSKLHFQSQNVL